MLNKMSRRIADYIVQGHKRDGRIVTSKIDGIYEDICELKRLKIKLIEKDVELARKKVEWEQTFDAIIDNIVIINEDRMLYKANRSFLECVKRAGITEDVIGDDWNTLKERMGIRNNICIVDKCFNTGDHIEDTITNDGKVYHVMLNPIKENGKVVSVVRISRDITKIETDKTKAERKSRILHSITTMSQMFADEDMIETNVNKIIRLLGDSIKVSRVYVYANTINAEESRLCATVYDEWRNDYACEGPMTQCINYDIVPTWKSGLSNGDIIQGDVPECNICEKKHSCEHTTTINAVPIFTGKEWWGFIGFDYDTTSEFRGEDEAILRIAADTIGDMINNRKTLTKGHKN